MTMDDLSSVGHGEGFDDAGAVLREAGGTLP